MMTPGGDPFNPPATIDGMKCLGQIGIGSFGAVYHYANDNKTE